MQQAYGTSAPVPARTRPVDPGAMTVSTAGGPAATVHAPRPGPRGPRLNRPTPVGPVLGAAQNALKPTAATPTPMPVNSTPVVAAPSAPAPAAVKPTPIPFAPPPSQIGVQQPGNVLSGERLMTAEELAANRATAARDAAATGAAFDPAGTTHTMNWDQQRADGSVGPGQLTGDTMQRPGGPVESGPVKGTPDAGTYGGADVASAAAMPNAGPGAVPGGSIAPAPINFAPPGVSPASTGASMTGAQGGFTPQAAGSAAAPAAAGAASAAPGVATSAITGDETPYAVNPTQSAGLSQLLARAQSAVMQGLDSPTAWDDPLAASVKESARRGIDNNYADADQSLSAELAQRGLSYSDIASKRYLDLGSQKANALTDLDTNIARERANSIAQGRSSALSAAMNAIGMNAGLESNARTEQRGERSYVDTLRNKAQSDAVQETLLGSQLGQQNFDNIFRLIQSGMGYGTNGANLLGAAGSGYGYAGGQYGQQADAGNAQLGDLSQLAMQLFGGRQ